jgi:autotransporter-associated beta strand protein
MSDCDKRWTKALLACSALAAFQPLWAGVCNNVSPPYEIPAQTTLVSLDIDCTGVGGEVVIIGDVVTVGTSIFDETGNQDSWLIDVPAGINVASDASTYTVHFRSPDGEVRNSGTIKNAGVAGAILFNNNTGNAGPGRVYNAGSGEITSAGITLELQAGGEIINEPGGLILSQTSNALNAKGFVHVDNGGTISTMGINPVSSLSGNSGADIVNGGEIIGRVNFFTSGMLNVNNSGTITGLSGQQAVRAAAIPALIVNSGDINAGVGYPNAIELGNLSDTLELQPGYSINGVVIAGPGLEVDTLAFGGMGSDSFSFDEVDAAGQYQGFELLRMVSGSWTFNGTAPNDFYLDGGTMNLGAGSVGTGNFIQSDGVVQNGTLTADLYLLSGGTFDASIGNNNMVQVDGGPVEFGSNAALGIGALLSIQGGGFLDLGAGSQSTGALQLANGDLVNGTLTAGAFMVVEGEIRATLSGAGALTKDGPGTVELAGLNDYSGGTTVLEGELRGTTDSLQGDIVNEAELLFSQASDGIYSGQLSGSSGLLKIGGLGGITFSGDSSAYSGATQVTTVTLFVDGHLGGEVNVISGVLGGSGVISGTVSIAPLVEFASLAPGNGPGTLAVGNDLELSPNSRLIFELDSPGGSNDQVTVAGDLTLDGALQIIDLGGYGSGTYTLITYSGSLNDDTLELTALPDGFKAFLDTSNAGQVNLVVEPLSDGIFSNRFEP